MEEEEGKARKLIQSGRDKKRDLHYEGGGKEGRRKGTGEVITKNKE